MKKKHPQAELDFYAPTPRDALPSPKRTGAKTAARKQIPWEGNYAAFSTEFAIAAANRLAVDSKTKLFDPFVGSGTSLEAACTVGIPCCGIELNPFSALLARSRVAFGADQGKVNRLLSSAARYSLSGSTTTSPAEWLAKKLCAQLGCEWHQLIRSLCSVTVPQLETEIVALVCALHTRYLSNHHFRSNPAWLIPGESPDRPTDAEVPWLENALLTSSIVFDDFYARDTGQSREIEVIPCDFREARIRRSSIKRFLTSPPYLNRLDYINPSVPALSVLGERTTDQIEELRTRMMGTTKMRPSLADSRFTASETTLHFLRQVSQHQSKASGTYYLKFFSQYFSDLCDFIQWLHEHAAKSVEGLVVLQNSYYKEITIPLVEIVQELSKPHGFAVKVIREDSSTRHMGALSPHQQSYAPDKKLTEFVLSFTRG